MRKGGGELTYKQLMDENKRLRRENAQLRKDAEPVTHAKWLNAVDFDPGLYGWVYLDTVLCSHCKTLEKENRRKTLRCPNCGAIMDLK